MAQPPTELFDQAELQAMTNAIGAEAMGGILHRFAQGCEKQVDDIAGYVVAKDSTAVRKEAHSLKGGAASVYATRLELVSAAIEADPESVDAQRLEELQATAVATLAWIEQNFAGTEP